MTVADILNSIITMFYSDHQPPHFHVRYGDYKAQVTIDPISILRGELYLARSQIAVLRIGEIEPRSPPRTLRTRISFALLAILAVS